MGISRTADPPPHDSGPPGGAGLDAKAVLVSVVKQGVLGDPLAELTRFRGVFYDCLTGRRDALFELTDAMLCSDGPSGRWWT